MRRATLVLRLRESNRVRVGEGNGGKVRRRRKRGVLVIRMPVARGAEIALRLIGDGRGRGEGKVGGIRLRPPLRQLLGAGCNQARRLRDRGNVSTTSGLRRLLSARTRRGRGRRRMAALVGSKNMNHVCRANVEIVRLGRRRKDRHFAQQENGADA